MSYVLSDHVKQRANERGIPLEMIDQIMNAPQQTVDETEPGQKVYQSVITFPENKTYLVRVFIDTEKEPNVVKSVYRTSKLDKYYEGKVWSRGWYSVYQTDRPGMVIDYDIQGMIVGFEVMNASKRMAQPNLVELEIA